MQLCPYLSLFIGYCGKFDYRFYYLIKMITVKGFLSS